MSARRWKNAMFAKKRAGEHNPMDDILDDPHATNQPVARLIAQAAGPASENETAGLDAALAAFASAADLRPAAVASAPARRRVPMLKGLAAATLATKLTAAGVAVAAVGSVVVTVAVEHRSHPRHHPAPSSSTAPNSARPSGSFTDNGSNPVPTRTATAHRTASPDRTAAPSGPATGAGSPTALPSGLVSPSGVVTTTPGRTRRTPPGQTKTPPGRTKTPPGQTKTPPG